MGWLYCLLDDTHEFAGQIFEVRLVPQLEGEGFEGLPRVVLAAVEAAVYERLDAVPDGVEEGPIKSVDATTANWDLCPVRAIQAPCNTAMLPKYRSPSTVVRAP